MCDGKAWTLSLFSQVTVLRSYDTMIATARRQAEGSLIYIIDKADLYLRVRNGLRQVMVRRPSSFIPQSKNLCRGAENSHLKELYVTSNLLDFRKN